MAFSGRFGELGELHGTENIPVRYSEQKDRYFAGLEFQSFQTTVS